MHLLLGIAKFCAVSLLGVVLLFGAVQDSQQVAVNSQRITSLESDVRDMKPLMAQMAAMKQTLDYDHYLLTAIGIAITLDILARLRKRPEKEERKSRAMAAGTD